MDQNMVQVEKSATAVQKVMFTEYDGQNGEVASLAGVTDEEFRKLYVGKGWCKGKNKKNKLMG